MCPEPPSCARRYAIARAIVRRSWASRPKPTHLRAGDDAALDLVQPEHPPKLHRLAGLAFAQGLRYSISEAARRTVLDRLLALNHQRYAEEVMAGLHD